MKLLVAIPVCHQYRYGAWNGLQHFDMQTGRVEAVRATWWKDFAKYPDVTCRLFYGWHERDRKADEVFLNCRDDYDGLPFKVHAIILWAYVMGFDFILKVDDDTFVYADRFMKCGFEAHDWTGFKFPEEHNFVPGGSGYVLSRKAMEAIVNTDVATAVDMHAEDFWIDYTLRKNKFKAHVDTRFHPALNSTRIDLTTLPPGDYVTLHSVSVEDMYTLYKSLQDENLQSPASVGH